METYTIIISREKSFYGSAIRHTVELDGLVVGELRNGGTLQIQAAAGNHVLSFVKRGKIEKSIPVEITQTMALSARMNGSQKLEISRSGTNVFDPGKKKKKRGVWIATICVLVFAFFAIVIALSPDEQSGDKAASASPSQAAEITDEEKAAEQREKAESKFQSGDYMGAIKICDQITADYPDTEISVGMPDYINSQLAQYPHYSAMDLMSEYTDNVVNADAQYNGTVMVVTGTVSSIGKTNNDSNLTVILKSGTYFCGVQLNFKTSQTDSVAELREGDTVTAVGKCSGQSGKVLLVLDGSNVMIENCYIVK
jgi:hypothetical protein